MYSQPFGGEEVKDDWVEGSEARENEDTGGSKWNKSKPPIFGLRSRGFIEEYNIWNLSRFGAIFLTFHGCFYNRVNTNRGGIPHFPGLPRMFL